ncbi:MAG TPA: nucleotide pyrophosphohydrolase, partial [Desulfobulbus sp.]|nr:nucleotide pyrophosphohydrolase [Desulfobulbus sp.]
MSDSLAELTLAIRRFADERDWEQFHSPKNLAMALIVEAGELVEHFQWLSQEESRHLDADQRRAVSL